MELVQIQAPTQAFPESFTKKQERTYIKHFMKNK